MSLSTSDSKWCLVVKVFEFEVGSSFDEGFNNLKISMFGCEVQGRLLEWTRCVHIRVEACIMLVVLVLRVESGLLFLLVFKNQLHRLDASQLAGYHQRRYARIICIVNDLALLDQEFQDVWVLVGDCVVDEITAFSISLEARWVQPEKVFKD